jgi:3-isopropylmalate dehydrogenase
MSNQKRSFEIAVLPGDGVGPEVVDAALISLRVLSELRGFQFNLETIPGGGNYYETHGKEWPDGSFERVQKADAIILGAVGHDGPDGQPVRRADGELAGYELVVGLRAKLDLYANMRPVKLFKGVQHRIHGNLTQVWSPEKVDMVIIRENTEDAYAPGSFRIERGGSTELVVSPTIITRKGTERVVRKAFELARRRNGAPSDGKRRVTCVEKSNIVRAHKFFREICKEISAEYPDIEVEYAYTDAFCQWLVRTPEYYDVVVSPNFSGDVITDLAAVLQGGLGVAAGGNVGDHHAMFEPIHGSAPRHAGLNKVNPVATLLAIRMMLGWLGEQHDVSGLIEAGDLLEQAVEDVIQKENGRTYDLGGNASCSEVGQRVADRFGTMLGS